MRDLSVSGSTSVQELHVVRGFGGCGGCGVRNGTYNCEVLHWVFSSYFHVLPVLDEFYVQRQDRRNRKWYGLILEVVQRK